jgi:hypothetical protein
MLVAAPAITWQFLYGSLKTGEPRIVLGLLVKPGADDGFLSGEIENIVFTPQKSADFCLQTADKSPASPVSWFCWDHPQTADKRFWLRAVLLLNMFDRQNIVSEQVCFILPADNGFLSENK